MKAYNSFGEAALKGIDVAILMVLVNELFIKGELFHIWNAHESEVVKAVATGSDETPTAANNVAKALNVGGGNENVAAKSANLIGNVSDDAGKVVGTAEAGTKGVALKSVVAKTGSVTGKVTSTAPVVSSGMEHVGAVVDPTAVVATLPNVEKIITPPTQNAEVVKKEISAVPQQKKQRIRIQKVRVLLR